MSQTLAARRSSRRPYVASIATAGALAAMGFITSAVAARLLQPSERGVLAAIQVLPGFLALLGMVGQMEAVAYFAARRDHPLGLIQGTALRLAGFGSGIAILVGLIGVPLLLRSRGTAVLIAGLIYLLFCPALSALTVGPSWLRARNRVGAWNLTRLVPPIVWTLVVGVAWVRHDRSPSHLAITFVLLLSVTAVPIILASNRAIDERPVRDARELRKPLLKYGLPAMATAAPQLLNLRLDQTVMAVFLPDRQLGFYVTAVGWSSAISLLLNGFGFMLLPAVAGQRDRHRQRETFRRLVLRGALFAAALTAAVLVITPLLFASRFVFSGAYRPAVPAAMVLCAAAGVLGFNQILSEAIRGLGRPDIVLRSELGGLVVTVVLIAALLGPFGIMGAAWASFAGYSAVTIQLLVRASRQWTT